MNETVLAGRVRLAEDAMAAYRQWEAAATPDAGPATPEVMGKLAAALDLLLEVTRAGL